jgi:starch phosphorylase
MQELAAPESTIVIEDDRTATSVETLRRAILDNLFYLVGTTQENATDQEFFTAVAYTVRDRILSRWFKTRDCYKKHDVRVVCYLSAEFLMGPHLANNLLNLQIEAPVRQAVTELGRDFDQIVEQEREPGLGNGGLGRLAACYLDSMATLGVPALGYGIRYEFGIFQQQIHDGWQVELTDYWLRYGNPWEIRRPNEAVDVGYGGHTEGWGDSAGKYHVRWIPASVVRGVPYDTPIVGYRSGIANDLRLWRSESTESFYFEKFNSGDIRAPSPERPSPKISPRSFIRTTKTSTARSFAYSSSTSSRHVPCRT